MYNITLHNKDINSWTLLTSDVNKLGGQMIKVDTLHDVKKVQRMKFKNSFISYTKIETRAEYLASLKRIYPKYSFRQLKEIGFNI